MGEKNLNQYHGNVSNIIQDKNINKSKNEGSNKIGTVCVWTFLEYFVNKIYNKDRCLQHY